MLAVCLNDIPELFNNLARPPRWLMWLHERAALVRLLVNAEGREIDSVERLFSEPEAPRVREALARFFDEVRELRREVEVDGASLALVVLPFRFQVEPQAPAPLVQERIAAFLPGGAAALPRPAARDRARRPGGVPRLRPPEPVGRAARRGYAAGERSRGRVGVESRGAVARARGARRPELVRVLARDETNAVVAAALARVGPAAKAAVPELMKALASDDDDGRRWRAARTLGRIGQAAEPAVPALTGALADPNGVVRAHAARALGRIGPGAIPAAAALQRATGDREAGVRDEARLALERLRGRPD